jgi:hypothetical protein
LVVLVLKEARGREEGARKGIGWFRRDVQAGRITLPKELATVPSPSGSPLWYPQAGLKVLCLHNTLVLK